MCVTLKNRIIKITLVIFIFLFITTCYSQNDKSKIDYFISKAKQIDSELNNFTKIEKYKDSIGSKNFYTLNDTLQKIEISTIENNTLKKVNWYYHNTTLFYIEKLWNDITSQKLIDSEKIIIEKNKIIAWLNANNQLIDFNTNDYNQLCIQIIEFGNYLKNNKED